MCLRLHSTNLIKSYINCTNVIEVDKNIVRQIYLLSIFYDPNLGKRSPHF